MKLATCFLPVGLSLKRWSMVFVLATAAIYGVTTNAHVACLGGRLTLACDTEINMVRQSMGVPIVDAQTATLGGPRSHVDAARALRCSTRSANSQNYFRVASQPPKRGLQDRQTKRGSKRPVFLSITHILGLAKEVRTQSRDCAAGGELLSYRHGEAPREARRIGAGEREMDR